MFAWLSFPLFLAYLFSTFTWVPAAAPSAPITRIVLRSKSGNNNNSKTHRRISASSWEKSSDRRHTVIVSTVEYTRAIEEILKSGNDFLFLRHRRECVCPWNYWSLKRSSVRCRSFGRTRSALQYAIILERERTCLKPIGGIFREIIVGVHKWQLKYRIITILTRERVNRNQDINNSVACPTKWSWKWSIAWFIIQQQSLVVDCPNTMQWNRL